MTDKPGKVVFIQLDPEGKLCNALAESTYEDGSKRYDDYAFEWSKAQETYYWEHLGIMGRPAADFVYTVAEWADGSPSHYWVVPGTEVKVHANAVKVESLPSEHDPEAIFENYEEGETVYCSVCDDRVLCDWGPPCHHLRWIDTAGDWGGCGSVERNPSEQHKESFFAVLKKTKLAKELREALLTHTYRIGTIGNLLGTWGVSCCLQGRHYDDAFTENLTDAQEEAMSIGMAWLWSLEAGVTDEADLLTVQWIDEWLAAKRGRTAKREVAASSGKEK